MLRMEKHIREALVVRLETDPAWAHLQVVFSGSDEPGEGEHKILQAMRRRRALPGYDPNRRRFIFGQDADLILLGLTTHEPRLCILREQWGAAEAVVAAVKEKRERREARDAMAVMAAMEGRGLTSMEGGDANGGEEEEEQEHAWTPAGMLK